MRVDDTVRIACDRGDDEKNDSTESGKFYDPSLELAFKLARHYDCTIEELFDPDLDS